MNIFLLCLPFFPLCGLVIFTMGVSNKLGHSHASGGFSRVCHVSLVCLTIEDCIYRAPGSCSVKIACV